MHEIESLIFLLAAAALLAQLARVLKVPYPILLVLGGLVMGFVPGLPNIEIPPEVIFVAFLPPLLNSAAFSSSPLYLRPTQADRVARRGTRARHDGSRCRDRARPDRPAVGGGFRTRGNPRPNRSRDGSARERGPYWYFQYHEGGKRKKLYLGKTGEPDSTLAAKRSKPLGE